MPSTAERQLEGTEIAVEFEDAHEEALVRTAVIGRNAEDFFRSDVGQFVLGSAAQDQKEIEAKLTSISPNSIFGRRKIAKLQQEHRAIQCGISWLADCIRVGKEAHRELEERME